ncbi:MAG: hypothetical protein ACRDTT_08945, partial [Pseudonocardiaceae bacterium]
QCNGRVLPLIRGPTDEDYLTLRHVVCVYSAFVMHPDVPIQLSDLPWPQGRAERWPGVRPSSGTPPPFPPVRSSPVLGATQARTPHRQAQEHVEHDVNQLYQGTDNQRHGDGQDQQQLDSGRSIRSGTAVPPTVLVAEMGDGSLFLQGWRNGPSGGRSEAL